MRSGGRFPDGDRRDLLDLGVGLIATAVVLVLTLATLAAVLVSDRGWDLARERGEASAERAGVQIGAQLSDVVSGVDLASRSRAAGMPVSASEPQALRFLEIVPVEGEVDDPGLAALLRQPAIRDAAGRARDTGEVVVSAPTASDPPVAVFARALYVVDGATSAVASEPTSARRRAEHAGTIVAAVDPGALLGGEGREDDAGAVRLTDGDVVLAGPARMLGSSAVAAIPVLDRRWQLEAAIDPPSQLATWLVVAVGFAAAAAVAAGGMVSRAAVRRSQSNAAGAADHAEAVVAYAGVLQESHDLGEVLPALTVLLADHLGLAGISLSVVVEGGRTREIFSHGELPDRSADAAAPGTWGAAAGETVVVRLRRAERSVGELRARCGRALGPDDLDQLHIVSELVTSTIIAARSAEQQQDAVDRLRSLDALKTSFLGTASHELRTPVTAIAGFARMLSDRWDGLTEENRRVFADRIALNARVLEALVQDLLDFARLERGELRLVLEPVDLAAVADRVLDRLEPVWSTHTVVRSIAEQAPVTGDVSALERIVTNLVSNAVKFSPDGSTVRVGVELDTSVRLVVDDQGPGVPEEDRERIFVRFYRGEGDAVVRTSGVGIGLSVVQDYVEQMGGRIHVAASPDGGARFVVELERAEDPERDERETSDATT